MKTLMIGGHLDGQTIDLQAHFGVSVGRTLVTVRSTSPDGSPSPFDHEFTQITYRPFELRATTGRITVYFVEGSPWDYYALTTAAINAIVRAAGLEYDHVG